MATRWVSSAARGLDDGTSYANAWGTINQAWVWLNASGTKGDIINVVNDGTHVLPSSVTLVTNAGLNGTDYDTDPGFVVQGTDTLGVADTAIMQAQVGVAGTFLSIRAGVNYIDVKGFKWDHSTTVSASKVIEQRDATGGPVRVRDFHYVGHADNDPIMGSVVRRVFDFTGAPPNDWGEVSHGIIQNCGDPFENGAGTAVKLRLHHLVFWNVGQFVNGFSMRAQFSSLAAAANVVEFYNNTFYVDVDDDIAVICLAAPVAGDYGTVNFHSNVIWIESSSGSGTIVSNIFGGSGGSAATNVGTIGFNVMYTGPSVLAGEVAGFYDDPWDDAVDPKANDNVDYQIANTTLFEAPSSGLAWLGTGNGYTITVPGDLRLKLHKTSGLAGVAPGALGAAETDLSVTNTPNRSNPKVNETVAFTVVAANTGSLDAGVLVTGALPSGLTYVSHVASAGSYDSGTGTWTLGTVASGASETLTITTTVDSDQAGNSLVYTATISGTLLDPTPGNDVAAATLSVVNSADVGDPDGEGAAPLIDTFPIYTTDLRFSLNMRMLTKKNRKTMDLLRKDVEDQRWREMLVRRMNLSTNTTTTVNLGGIQRAEYMLVESDVAVQVGIGDSTASLYPASKAVALVVTDFELLQIKNPSTTDEATILLVVTD